MSHFHRDTHSFLFFPYASPQPRRRPIFLGVKSLLTLSARSLGEQDEIGTVLDLLAAAASMGIRLEVGARHTGGCFWQRVRFGRVEIDGVAEIL